jgi:hypothetical protein
MTKPAAIFRASYSDWKLIRTRKCVQIILEVPLEGGLAHAAYAALGGMPDPAAETWVAVAHLDPETVKEVMPDITGPTPAQPNDMPSREEVMPDTTVEYGPSNKTSPASGPDIPARAHKPVAAEKRLAQRAGILCADPEFREFIRKVFNEVIGNKDDAANFVRRYCRIDSRSKITLGTEAGNLFDRLHSNFITWRDSDKYVEASA